MYIFPWHGFRYHGKVHREMMSKTKQLCVCQVSQQEFASSIADGKLNFPVNFPQSCPFTRWVPTIIFGTRFVMEMVFDFHFPCRTDIYHRSNIQFLLSHSFYLPCSHSHSLHFFLYLSLSLPSFSLFLFSLPSLLFFFRHYLTRHFLRPFQKPSSGVGAEINLASILGAWEQVCSPGPCSWWQFWGKMVIAGFCDLLHLLVNYWDWHVIIFLTTQNL